MTLHRVGETVGRVLAIAFLAPIFVIGLIGVWLGLVCNGVFNDYDEVPTQHQH